MGIGGEVEPGAATGSRSPWERLWFAGLAVAIFLMLPVWMPRFTGLGVDDSWLAVLHHFASSGLQFGQDLVFTRGPLGFLQLPFFQPGTYTSQILFYLLVGGSLALAAWDALPARSEGGWGLSLATLFALFFYLRRPDALLLVVAAAYVVRRCFVRRSGVTPIDVTVLCCLAVAALGKPLHLFAALVAVGFSVAVEWRTAGRISRVPLVFGAWTLALYLAAGQRLASLPAFLGTSWEMTRGYGDVLSGGTATSAPLVALGLVGTLSLLLGADVPERFTDRAMFVLALGAILAVGFELGLLRPHRFHVPSQTLLGVSVLAALQVRRRSGSAGVRRVAVAVPMLVLAIHLVVVARSPSLGLADYHLREVRRLGFAALRMVSGRLVPPYPRLLEIHAEAEAELRRLEPMPRPPGSVDVFGRWQAAALAHGLDLRPRPVFQSQMAYSPKLAALNARFYRSVEAPHFVLARIEGYQRFHPASLDGPALVELLRCYSPVGGEGEFLLLARRTCSAPGRRLLLDRTVELGSSDRVATRVDLDALAGEGPLWLEVEAERSPIGRLAALAWTPGRLRIDVVTGQGPATSYRLSPGVGRAGFLISPSVVDTQGFERLFSTGGPGEGLPAVEGFYLYRADAVPGEFAPQARVRVWALAGIGPRALAAPPG